MNECMYVCMCSYTYMDHMRFRGYLLPTQNELVALQPQRAQTCLQGASDANLADQRACAGVRDARPMLQGSPAFEGCHVTGRLLQFSFCGRVGSQSISTAVRSFLPASIPVRNELSCLPFCATEESVHGSSFCPSDAWKRCLQVLRMTSRFAWRLDAFSHAAGYANCSHPRVPRKRRWNRGHKQWCGRLNVGGCLFLEYCDSLLAIS